MSNEYINKHRKIIEVAGGIVNDIFVETIMMSMLLY